MTELQLLNFVMFGIFSLVFALKGTEFGISTHATVSMDFLQTLNTCREYIENMYVGF